MSNIACDYEINNLLTEYNDSSSRPVILPKDGCVDLKRFKTLAAEVILKTLQEETPPPPPPPPPPPKPPEGEEGECPKPPDGEGDGEGDGEDDGGKAGDQEGGKGGSQPDKNKGNKPEGKSGGGSGKGEAESDPDKGGGAGQPADRKPMSPGEFEIPKGTPEELAEQEDKWKEILSTSIHASKLRGDAPGGFLEKLKNMQKSPVNMKDILQKYADEFCLDEGSTKPDRRYLAVNDLCIAGMEDERIGSLVFVNDTSGSMPARIAEVCVAVVQDAVNTLNAETLIHMDVDCRVAKVREYAPYQLVDTEIHGRGGTDFCPAFDWIESSPVDPRVVIYMTDGHGCFPKNTPQVPVLWLTWDSAAAHYPFGDVVDLRQLDVATS
tara:strand:+ start:100 stop:1239 length:1140 start_codon:yes stop_codon:yes gene_type:complete